MGQEELQGGVSQQLTDLLLITLKIKKIASMASFAFYNYFKDNFEVTFTGIITKIYDADKSIIVRTTSNLNLNYLDSLLWNFNPTSFVPHDKSDEPLSRDTPVYLTTGGEVTDNAETLILVNGAKFYSNEFDSFSKVIIIFCKTDPDSIIEARNIWQSTTSKQIEKQYWIQNEFGWSKNIAK